MKDNKFFFTSTPSELIVTFHILSYFNMDDSVYTHCSIRDIDNHNAYWMNPLGPLFSDLNVNSLLKLDLAGNILEGNKKIYNPTGENIHGSIYNKRLDVGAVIHFHTPSTIIISSLECGLLPVSQFSLHFFNNISYYDYNGLVLSNVDKNNVVKALSSKSALLMRNHGAVVFGKNIQEAFFYHDWKDS